LELFIKTPKNRQSPEPDKVVIAEKNQITEIGAVLPDGSALILFGLKGLIYKISPDWRIIRVIDDADNPGQEIGKIIVVAQGQLKENLLPGKLVITGKIKEIKIFVGTPGP